MNWERVLGNFIVGFCSGLVIGVAVVESRTAFLIAIGNALIQGGLTMGLELKSSPPNRKDWPLTAKLPIGVLF